MSHIEARACNSGIYGPDTADRPGIVGYYDLTGSLYYDKVDNMARYTNTNHAENIQHRATWQARMEKALMPLVMEILRAYQEAVND